ncbi:MAG: F0F1 ATP synthase subunit A, partial [Anaerovoracaceae bacterium]
MEIGPRIIIKFGESGVFITETVLFSAIVAIVLIVLCIWLASGLQKVPKGKQVIAETIVMGIYNLVRDTMGPAARAYAPYIGTLFLFLLLGSMLGFFGQRPITADVNTAFAMSGITFIL